MVLVVTGIAAAGIATDAAATPRPDNASLYLISPVDGQRVRSAFWCRFGLRNMGVAPAGISQANTGHHHLLIDTDEQLDPATPIPADAKHVHFGAGQTEVRLDLARGYHTLQLVLGDGNHMLLTPSLVSRRIRILVT